MTTGALHHEHYTQSLERFRRGYDALFALLNDFPLEKCEEAGACGNWSPRQILAHLAGWVEEAAVRYRDFEAGDTSERQYNHDDDWAAFNARSLEARAALDWQETYADLWQSVDTLTQYASAITPEAAKADPRYEEWLTSLWRDVMEHIGQLCRFVEKKQDAR